jgi:hypothetical protein
MKFCQYQDQALPSAGRTLALPDASPTIKRATAEDLRGQLVPALRETYEKTATWLGSDSFDRHAANYIQRYASTSWTEDDYRDHFVDHLTIALSDRIEVGELAWLDRALWQASSSGNVRGLTLDQLDAEDWERVEFEFVSTLKLRRLQSNAPAIWSSLGKDDRPTVRPGPLDGGVRVWRTEWKARFMTIGSEEYACLDLALGGATFGELCTWLAGVVGDTRVAQTAGPLIQAWASDGLIAGIRETPVTWVRRTQW